MHSADVQQRVDAVTNLPHVIQRYHVPIPQNCLSNEAEIPSYLLKSHTGGQKPNHGFSTFHDRCLYSMWMHFVTFCERLQSHTDPCQTSGDNCEFNRFLGTPRLPFLKLLADSGSDKDITSEVPAEVLRVTPTHDITDKHSSARSPCSVVAPLQDPDAYKSRSPVNLVPYGATPFPTVEEESFTGPPYISPPYVISNAQMLCDCCSRRVGEWNRQRYDGPTPHHIDYSYSYY